MRVDRIGTVFFAAALVVAGFWGCGGGKGDTGGAGGTGGTGGTGGKMTTTTTTTTTTTGPTTTTTTGDMMGDMVLGNECEADTDCGMGYKCILPTDNDSVIGGGAAGGYCTKPCTGDADCGGNGSTCLDDGNGNKECFLGCQFGMPPIMYLNDPLDPSKCRGREDLRCQQLQDGSNVCLPTCGEDAQCGNRVCDPRLAVCVDTPNKGKALGEKCDPMAMMTDCAGICIGVTGNKSECTSPCVMGGAADATATDCGGITKGVCLYSPQGTGVGDLGFCAKSCKKQDDCQYPDWACFNINLKSNGVCLDTATCTSDADCGMLPKGAKCLDTTAGKFCGDPAYDLGSLKPGGSSSSSTTGAGGAGSSSSGSTGGAMSSSSTG